MCCIFDQLSGPERRPLHLVCHGWYRMLTTKHYLLGRRLRLSPDNVELFEMNGEDVRKFPCVRVRDDESSPRSVNRRNFLSLLRRVVFGEDVLENLQELTLEGVQSDLLAEMFGGCLVRFPNLKLLALNCFEFDALHDKLELLVRIEKDDYLLPWNLPNLANLHTYVENLAPLGEDLPALATIRISNHTIREGRFSNRPVERFYLKRYFSHFETILKLFLYDVYLEEDLLLQFPKMKVREIILRCVRTSSLILDIIYERAPAIFYLRFWDCCFLVSPRAKIPSFEALGRLLPHVRISHSSSKIIATSSSTATLDHDLPTILLS
ncbi:hypothetical protein pipiens_007180 [Culex pipiens pipiens]|uniref:F-box domain-containing protein n=1 Tax=Culex pipiens pipiens TaxID=38569 RepID=A0ABD1DMD9_CULPP